MKLPSNLASFLHDTPRARAAYAEGAGIYRIVPQAVAVPRSTAELTKLVQWAAGSGIALTPRGAGSAVTGSSVGTDIVVDLTRLEPRHISIDPVERRVTASPAVTLAELNAAAAAHSLRLPPDPSSAAWATLGGMLSTNASGARSVRYGSVRAWALGCALLTAEAELTWLGRGTSPARPVPATRRFETDVAPDIRQAEDLIGRTFPPTRKNSSGYALDAWLQSGDLLDLVIGAEGTLGFVTNTQWRLDPVPPARAGLRISLAGLEDLSAVVQALLPLEPSALELLDRTFLDLVRPVGHPALEGLPPDAQAVLLVEFEGESDKVLRGTVGDAVRRTATWAAETATAVTPEAEHRLWALRHAASPIIAGLPRGRRSLQVIEDGAIPVNRMGDYIRLVREEAALRDLPVVIFGHAGDGNLHVNLLAPVEQTGWEQQVAGLYHAVSRGLRSLGGTPSGEHGDGRLRAGLLETFYGPAVVRLFRLVKGAFDPAGIMNPGVILPGAAGPFEHLKAGAGAVPLPDDIAAALRGIERSGGYGRWRMELAVPHPLAPTPQPGEGERK